MVSFLAFTLSSVVSNAALAASSTPTLQSLPKIVVDSARITVSGVSSGGFMAVQLHVAHSGYFKGAASVAGGIYECAKGDSTRSQKVCMIAPDQIDVKEILQIARDRSARGEIDDLRNLTSSRIAIFSSPKDEVIKSIGSDKLAEFYSAFVPKASITRLTNADAAHGFPTLKFGSVCSATGTPWILNCNDDVAGKLLTSLEPNKRALSARGRADASSLLYFDQSKHVSATARMYDWGAVYIPKGCYGPSARCGIHIALHGCQMNPDFVGRQFIEQAGYNEWAETNRLIVVFPQSAKGRGNPYGCWDWFGLTGPNYTTKSAPQIAGIRKIVNDLTAR